MNLIMRLSLYYISQTILQMSQVRPRTVAKIDFINLAMLLHLIEFDNTLKLTFLNPFLR